MKSGCEKLLLSLAPILNSDLFNYCKSFPWPLISNRLLVLKKFLIQKKINNNRKSESNQKNLSLRLQRAALILVNNYSFAHSLHLEFINQHIQGVISQHYRAVSMAFCSLPEWGILALYPYESKVSACMKYISYTYIKFNNISYAYIKYIFFSYVFRK